MTFKWRAYWKVFKLNQMQRYSSSAVENFWQSLFIVCQRWRSRVTWTSTACAYDDWAWLACIVHATASPAASIDVSASHALQWLQRPTLRCQVWTGRSVESTQTSSSSSSSSNSSEMETMRHGAVINTNSPEYLVQLLKDKRQLQTVPGCFVHLERILDEGELINLLYHIKCCMLILIRDRL